MEPEIKRVNFFDGQFLKEGEFIDEQIYHLHMRRRMNYLFFDGSGVVQINPTDLTIEKQEPANSANKNFRVKAGMAIGINENVKEGKEIILQQDSAYMDLAAKGITAGQTAWITLHYEEQPVAIPPSAGSVQDDTRVLEHAQISIHSSEPPSMHPTENEPFIRLGSIIFDTMEINDSPTAVPVERNVTLLRSSLVSTTPVTLTGIEIDQGSSLNINQGSSVVLSVTGTYSDSSSIPIPNASLNWSSNNPGVAAVADGTVNGQTLGSANIRAQHSSSGHSDTIDISVVTTVPSPVINPGNPFDPQTARANFFPVRVFGSNFAVDDPTPPSVTLIAVGGEVDDTPSPEVVLNNDGEIHFRVPDISTPLASINMRIAVETSGGIGLSPEIGPFFRWRPPA